MILSYPLGKFFKKRHLDQRQESKIETQKNSIQKFFEKSAIGALKKTFKIPPLRPLYPLEKCP